MVQIVYSIFQNHVPIDIQNFQFENEIMARGALRDTYEDMKKADKIEILKYDDKEVLEMMYDGFELHQLIIFKS